MLEQHVPLEMHHVQTFRFTAATESVEKAEEPGMSRVRVVSLIPFTSYQVGQGVRLPGNNNLFQFRLVLETSDEPLGIPRPLFLWSQSML